MPRRGLWPLRIVRARPRLFWSAAVGIAVTLGLSLMGGSPVTRLLTGWDVGIALYLVLVVHMMWCSDVARIRERTVAEDEGQLTILLLTALAALASMGAIFAELGSS